MTDIPKKIGIVIDSWKLQIFEQRFRENGYIWTQHPGVTPDTILLKIETDDIQALKSVVLGANKEAAAELDRQKGRTNTTLADGSPVTPDHRDIKPNGQQKGYVVLSEEERSKGFIRPVRRSYIHEKCGCLTTMSQAIAETYARDPKFYSGTFCVGCGSHFPVGPNGEFIWDGTNEKVGT